MRFISIIAAAAIAVVSTPALAQLAPDVTTGAATEAPVRTTLPEAAETDTLMPPDRTFKSNRSWMLRMDDWTQATGYQLYVPQAEAQQRCRQWRVSARHQMMANVLNNSLAIGYAMAVGAPYAYAMAPSAIVAPNPQHKRISARCREIMAGQVMLTGDGASGDIMVRLF